jgi:tetratricopeptide (TPR) repeat protein
VTSSDVAAVPDPELPDGRYLVERYAAIADALESELSPSDRDRVKQDIIALFREADAALGQFAVFKESVKSLVTRWKQLNGTPTSSPLTPPGPSLKTPLPNVTAAIAPPTVSARVDHLGASTFIEKGWSKLSLGDAPGAETALRRALELTPGNNEAETLLGWAQMMQQQYDSALLTFHSVLLRDPQHALARTNVGYICLRKQIYGEAIEHLSRAIRIDNDRKATLYAHLYLGMVYAEREMYEDAELFFRRTLELGPNLLQAWYELGRARWFAGRIDDAKHAWRDGADANKFNPWGKRCAEMLAHAEQGGAPSRRD